MYNFSINTLIKIIQTSVVKIIYFVLIIEELIFKLQVLENQTIFREQKLVQTKFKCLV